MIQLTKHEYDHFKQLLFVTLNLHGVTVLHEITIILLKLKDIFTFIIKKYKKMFILKTTHNFAAAMTHFPSKDHYGMM